MLQMASVMIGISDLAMRTQPRSPARPASRSTNGAQGARRVQNVCAFFAAALGLCLPIEAAQAQSTRTYVSGRGSDANACTQSAPCLTLQGALAKTAAGGQIYALDSANYGPVTINKAITIASGHGATG